jgi:hypothetical protein
MAAINRKRVWLGAVVAWVVWAVWSVAVNVGFIGARYQEAQQAGFLNDPPRYPFFYGQWMVVLFLLSLLIAWLYASVRATQGAGPRTALLVGAFVGFAAGFPTNFATATWFPIERYFPLMWMLELWVGAILAALVAGWLYKD